MSYNIFRTDGSTRIVGCRSLLSRAPELVVYDFEGEKQWVSLTSGACDFSIRLTRRLAHFSSM